MAASITRTLKFPYLFIVISVCLVNLVLAQGFFIDLEALGFGSSTSSTDEAEGSKVLIAAPSELETVEVESKDDPNKSVKLTLAELKQLILGSVKEITSKVPAVSPINIKISTADLRKQIDSTTTTTTPAAIPASSATKYKYSSAYSDDLPDFEENSPWGSRPSDGDDYNNGNELSSSSGSKKPPPGLLEDDGWFSVAKSVLRRPSNIMNSYKSSFNRWRNIGKPSRYKQKPRRRPITDITYEPERRRRRKRPPPNRRHRPHPRRPYNRRSQVQEQIRPSSYDVEDYSETEYFEEYRQPFPSRNRMSNDFDSSIPRDDAPMNMVPPVKANF